MNLPAASRHVPKCSQSFPSEETATIVVNGEGEARIGPTIERLRQAARAAGEDAVKHFADDGISVTRVLDGDVLELLLSRGVIDAEEYACGQEFQRHWFRSGLAASGVIDPARLRVDGGTADHQSDVMLFHLNRWQGMVRGLGQIHSQVLCACVLTGESLTAFGLRHCGTTSKRMARDRAQERLKMALKQLVLNELGDKRCRMRSGMADGAKPVIQPPLDTCTRNI